jgi:hypothetical protein
MGDSGELHAPVLFVSGGNSDFTAQMTAANYERADVPKVHAENPDVGHVGMWDDPKYRGEPLVIGHQWLSFVLYGRSEGHAFFLGPGCGLCSRGNWSVRSGNWDGFAVAPSEAPPVPVPVAATPAPPPCPPTVTLRVRPRGKLVRARISVDGRRRAVLRGARRIRRGILVTVPGATSARIRIAGRTRSGARKVQVLRTKPCA